jgi:hypothetical protein
MTAPMPLRFSNPLKSLCIKNNLDYETVVGSCCSQKMRETLLLSEIQKPLQDIKNSDLKFVKQKMEVLDRKYGRIPKEQLESGETEDKGRWRYDLGATIEHVLPNSSQVYTSNGFFDCLAPSKIIEFPGTTITVAGMD